MRRGRRRWSAGTRGWRGGRADHRRAERHGQLYAHGADRARGAVDQQRLAAAYAEQVEYALGRLAGDGEGRRLGGCEPGGPRGDGGGLGQGVGRVGAGLGPAEDFVADGEAGDALADLVDGPGELVAGYGRQGGREDLFHPTVPDLVLDGIDPDGSDLHPDLARACVRLRDVVLEAQYLGSAELLENDGFHAGVRLSLLRRTRRGLVLRVFPGDPGDLVRSPPLARVTFSGVDRRRRRPPRPSKGLAACPKDRLSERPPARGGHGFGGRYGICGYSAGGDSVARNPQSHPRPSTLAPSPRPSTLPPHPRSSTLAPHPRLLTHPHLPAPLTHPHHSGGPIPRPVPPPPQRPPRTRPRLNRPHPTAPRRQPEVLPPPRPPHRTPV